MPLDLIAERALILDGATGSELQRRGVPVSRVVWTALASIEHYETLVSIHRDYVDAGADVITANTFATNRFMLAASDLDDRFIDLNSAAVAAAMDAARSSKRPVAVAGSISCLPPGFDTHAYPSPAEEIAGYNELAEALANLGVDLLLLEMMQDTRHARWALDAALRTGLPVWLGLSCRQDAGTNKLVAFDFPHSEFIEYADRLTAAGPTVVNIMHTPCTAVGPAMDALRSVWSGPVGAYPEVGSFDPVSRRRTNQIGPEELVAHAVDWYRRGACVLGGCCGAAPEHIRALHNMADRPGFG